MKLFICYSFRASPDDLTFMLQVSYWLRVQGLRIFFWALDGRSENPKRLWVATLDSEIAAAELAVVFRTGLLHKTQEKEIAAFIKQEVPICLVDLGGSTAPAIIGPPIVVKSRCARETAKNIVEDLQRKGCAVMWVCDDGLPIYDSGDPAQDSEGFPFKHEKDIINAYLGDKVTASSLLGRRLIHLGCPLKWPQIVQNGKPRKTKVDEGKVGGFRPEAEDAYYVAAQCLSRFDPKKMHERGIEFPEAGARQNHCRHPEEQVGRNSALQCGIVVAGGIAPGINAVIAGIVERHCLYASIDRYDLNICGFVNGFLGFGLPRAQRSGAVAAVEPLRLVEKDGTGYRPVDKVREHANEGGSILGTSRLPDLVNWVPEELQLLDRALDMAGQRKTARERGANLNHIVTQAKALDIQILYVIGGDGSMKAAHALWMTAKALNISLAVVGIPKTMDNDILWVWASFGFQSAVQQSTEVIRQLWTEASSNPRLCVIQLFGSDSGFVVTDAAAASGKCDLFLTPETPFSIEKTSQFLADKLSAQQREYAVVVMAESAVPTDVHHYIDDINDPKVSKADRDLLLRIELSRKERDALRQYNKDRRVIGQTPDDLRSGALKVVARVLQYKLQKKLGGRWRNLRMFTNEPRHLIRAIPPSSADIISARRFGFLAVDGAMAGFEDFMISSWLTEYVMVPLPLVVLGRKHIPTGGAFHAAARASTGQPQRLV